MSDMQKGLPPGWVLAEVNDTGHYINGLAFKPSDWGEVGRPIIRIQNLTDKAKEFNRTADEFDSDYIVQAGDILVSWSASLDAFIWDREDGVLNQHIFKVQPDRRVIDKNFLFPLLRHAISEMVQTEHLHGSTMKHINRGPFLRHPVVLPPINEQKRIVAKIEALQARSGAAKQALDAIPTLLEKLRQSVLAAAFRGDLTKAWREAHPDAEPASVLLERIRAERRRKWEAANPKKKYVEPEPVDADGLPDLPNGWCWATLDELVHTSRTGLVRSATEQLSEGGIRRARYVRMQNYDMTGRWYLDELPFVEVTEQERLEYTLREGDILFNTRNSYELVGKVAVWQQDRTDCVFNNNLRRLRLVSVVGPGWVGLQMQAPEFRARIRGLKSATTSICAIYTGDLLRQPIAVAPVGEQRDATAKLEAVISFVHRASGLRIFLERSSQRLTQSILAKAFRGELVPQDPTDEPASALLERIRTERESPTTTKPRATKRPRKPTSTR